MLACVVTTFMTPGGIPARFASCGADYQDSAGHSEQWERTSTSARHEKGVSAGGLMTAVQPAARAAPSLRVIMADGKFHGVNIDLHTAVSYRSA